MSYQHNHVENDDDIKELQRILSFCAKPETIQVSPSHVYSNITKLNLPQCGLSSLPDCLHTLLPNLSILFAPQNDFVQVPAIIGKCSELQMVSFKSGKLQSIHPDALQPQLRWLILTDNQIKTLPATIGRCTKLQKCMLSGNQLTSLPEEMKHCVNLELIRLACNQFQAPPMVLFDLPKLAWIALSGNPFLQACYETRDHGSHLPVLNDPRLDDETQNPSLGQGASGITRQSQWVDNTTGTGAVPRPVAVKTYYNSMTSDGNPQHERQVSMVASLTNSEALIHVLGQTQKGSLVMELLSNVTTLADPPSLESCSRDVYRIDSFPQQHTLGPAFCNRLVWTLLDTLRQLHSHGIVHGDFYGHNILISNKKDSEKLETSRSSDIIKLSDFGAAFFYDHDASYGKCLERIELRSFGILVEEVESILLQQCPGDKNARDLSQKLKQIAQLCQSSPSGKEETSSSVVSFEDLKIRAEELF